MAEIDGTLTVANTTKQLFRYSNGKWTDSLISVNIRSLMKCHEKGYVLIRDENGFCRHVSEIDSARVLAMLPVDHQLRYSSAIGHGGKIYIVGGVDEAFNRSAIVSVLDIETNKWTRVKSMKSERLACSLTTIGNKLFVGGGVGVDVMGSKDAHCLDLGAEKWTTLSPTTNKQCHFAALYGNLVATGGRCDENHKFSTSVEFYDKETDCWLPLPSMNSPRYGHGACTTEDNKLYVVGGWDYSVIECCEL